MTGHSIANAQPFDIDAEGCPYTFDAPMTAFLKAAGLRLVVVDSDPCFVIRSIVPGSDRFVPYPVHRFAANLPAFTGASVAHVGTFAGADPCDRRLGSMRYMTDVQAVAASAYRHRRRQCRDTMHAFPGMKPRILNAWKRTMREAHPGAGPAACDAWVSDTWTTLNRWGVAMARLLEDSVTVSEIAAVCGDEARGILDLVPMQMADTDEVCVLEMFTFAAFNSVSAACAEVARPDEIWLTDDDDVHELGVRVPRGYIQAILVDVMNMALRGDSTDPLVMRRPVPTTTCEGFGVDVSSTSPIDLLNEWEGKRDPVSREGMYRALCLGRTPRNTAPVYSYGGDGTIVMRTKAAPKARRRNHRRKAAATATATTTATVTWWEWVSSLFKRERSHRGKKTETANVTATLAALETYLYLASHGRAAEKIF